MSSIGLKKSLYWRPDTKQLMIAPLFRCGGGSDETDETEEEEEDSSDDTVYECPGMAGRWSPSASNLLTNF